MYYRVGISQLSPNQISRLRNGHPVRVKHGSSHHIHLTAAQIKKFTSASRKGKAVTVTFDPHQAEQHASGLMGDIAKGVKAAFHKHKHLLNPVIRAAKGYAHRGVAKATKYAHEKIDSFPEFQQGHGLIDDDARKILKDFKGQGLLGDLAIGTLTDGPMSVLPPRRRRGYGIKKHHKGKGLFGGVFNGAAGLSNLIGGHGSDEAAKVLSGIGGVANAFGLGLKHHKKHHHKRHGGSLYPAGSYGGGALYPA